MVYFNNGVLDTAEIILNKVIKSETNKDTLAKSYHYLGNINYQRSDFVKSLSFFKKAHSLYVEIGNIKKISNELNNIGLIYFQIGDLNKAKSYIQKSLDIDIKIGQEGINVTYTNLYAIENARGNYTEAEKNAEESIRWSIKVKDTLELAKGYSNLGVIMMNTTRYKEAINAFNKSLNISKDSINIAICYNNIGYVNYKINKHELADYHINKSISILKRMKSFNYLKDVYNQIHSLKYEKGDYKNSLDYYKLYIGICDSLISADNRESINKMITDYDNKFKTQERESYINVLEVEEKSSKQKITYLFIIVITTLLFIIAISVILYKYWNNYKQKKKLSEQLSTKNKELGDKNKDITDSIQYSKRLQNGILGDPSAFTKMIGKANLLYIPKDIVSGDFYWSCEKDGNKYISIGDCTGHGVPGSMITIIGHTSLTKIVEEGTTSPGEILEKLDKMVKASFSGNNDIKDGMDITLIKIASDGTVQFAGANNFIYLRTGNEFNVIKGNKCCVGTGESVFETIDVDLTGASHIYMLTDGILDQFGGANGKKFKQSGLKATINESAFFSEFVNTVNKWKEGFDQTDDITFLEISLK